MAANNSKLAPRDLWRRCNIDELDFESTDELETLSEIVGQPRALEAMTFAIDMHGHGYNTYALGPTGTGKSTTIRKFLERAASERPAPDDWLYVNDFENRDTPRCLRVPAGTGRRLRDDLDDLVEELKGEVPKAFESEEYKKQRDQLERQVEQQSEKLIDEASEIVEQRGFRLVRTPMGMAIVAVRDDQVMTPEKLAELSQSEQDQLRATQQELQELLRDRVRKAEEIHNSGKQAVRELDRRMVQLAVDHRIDELKRTYREHEPVVEHLDRARAALLDEVQAFRKLSAMQGAPQQQAMLALGDPQPSFDGFRANLIVDNGGRRGAPVVTEPNPSAPNLVGRIEHEGRLGTLVTDFRMIKPGALHRANGGYLIIDVVDLLTRPFAYQVLKRALKTDEVFIESVGEAYGAITTRTLKPEPIPLETKVILIGDPMIYYLLYQRDHQFKELFKVPVDFATRMDWTPKATRRYAQLIGTVCREEKLPHFDRPAVGRLVEEGSRLAEHQRKLSVRFGDIVTLVREAGFWAKKAEAERVEVEHVERAIDAKTFRSNRIEQRLQEMVEDGRILIDTTGSVIGQVNGLSVLILGDHAFGKPTRITARTRVGTEGVISIDREVELGGQLHNKGSMILGGYLGGKYARDIPLALTASLAFEQLYDNVEGDSAALAELCALLSSLADVPLRQSLAVSGSVNQRGEVQAVRGLNEKIEGFFDICQLAGNSTGEHGVIIPRSNVQNLMLRRRVVDAVARGTFQIYAADNVDEALELLTGISAGRQRIDGSFEPWSINDRVQRRLQQLTRRARETRRGRALETRPLA